EKIGVRKALKALTRPVKEIADAVQRQDAKWLTTLPGVGTATAEQIITTLKRKVTKFALAPTPAEPADGSVPTPVVIDGHVLEDAYPALMSVGPNPLEARQKIDAVIASGKTYKTVEDALLLIYTKQA